MMQAVSKLADDTKAAAAAQEARMKKQFTAAIAASDAKNAAGLKALEAKGDAAMRKMEAANAKLENSVNGKFKDMENKMNKGFADADRTNKLAMKKLHEDNLKLKEAMNRI